MFKLKGDLIELADQGMFDAIFHGCNTRACMGAGIARQIKQRWPKAAAVDAETKAVGGGLSYADVSTKSTLPLRVYNLYSQIDPGANFDIKLLEQALTQMARGMSIKQPGARIGFPAIGAGIGGGDWTQISRVIEALLGGDFTLIYVEYAPAQGSTSSFSLTRRPASRMTVSVTPRFPGL